MNDAIWQIFIAHCFLLMSLLENATSPWGQSWERLLHKHSCIHHSTCAFGTRAVICIHLCLCKTLSQDCPHGEIRHFITSLLWENGNVYLWNKCYNYDINHTIYFMIYHHDPFARELFHDRKGPHRQKCCKRWDFIMDIIRNFKFNVNFSY